MIPLRPATELTFNQTSYESGRRDVQRELDEQGETAVRYFELILLDVKHPEFSFLVGQDSSRAYLQVRFSADGEIWHGRKWLLSPHMTKSEVIQTAFKAVLTAIEHEAREHFLYKDRPVFGPHFDVDALHATLSTDKRE